MKSKLILAVGGLVAVGVIVALVIFLRPGKQAGPETPPGKPREVEAGKAGALEKSGARVEFSADAAVKDIAVRPEVPEANNRNFVPLSPAVAIRTDRVVFKEPLKVTLPYDPAKLPAAKPDDLYVVLRAGRAIERLDLATRIDAEKKSASFELDRLIPLVNSAGGDGGDGEVTVQLGGNRDGLESVDDQPDLQVRAPASLVTEARTNILAIKMLVLAARDEYVKKGFRVPATKLRVDYLPLRPTVWAQASGGDHIEINSAKFTSSDPGFAAFALAHEFFHLVQQTYKMANIKALKDAAGVDVDPLDGRWMDEGTADFVPSRLKPEYVRFALDQVQLDFGYRALETYEDDSAFPPGTPLHQYETCIFWAYLDSRYDALALIAKCYELRLSNRVTEFNPSDDKARNRGAFHARFVLDQVLKTTPDRKGEKHNLREVYADFLLHLYWFKDFDPLRTTPGNVFGRSKELRVPTVAAPGSTERTMDPKYVTAWNLPEDKDGKRVYQKSETVDGDNFAIAKSFRISSMTAKSKNERGDLTLTMQASNKAREGDVLMVVFPVKGGAQDPLIGNPKNPVVVPGWESHTEAVVWLVDLSHWGHTDMTLTAEMKPPGKLQVETQRPEKPAVNYVVVTSENLGKLDDQPAGTTLELDVWAASSPDSTFRPVKDMTTQLQPGHPIAATKPGSPDFAHIAQRIAKDKFVLVDHAMYRAPGRDSTKPIYYKVVERWIKADGKPGEVSQSQVTELGPMELNVRTNPNYAKETGKDQFTDERALGSMEIYIQIVCKTQHYAPAGVPVTVRAGSWQGHFWSPRREGNVSFGGNSDIHSFSVFMPMGASSSVTVTANIEGQAISKTIQVLVRPKPDVLDARAKQRAAAQLTFDRESAVARKYIEDGRRSIPSTEKRIAEEAKAGRATWDWQERLISERFSLERNEKVRLPRAEVNFKQDIAIIEHDHAATLRAMLRSWDLIALEREIHEREQAEVAVLKDNWAADPKTSEKARQDYAAEKAGKASRRAQHDMLLRRANLTFGDPNLAVRYAADAADPALLKDVGNRVFPALTERAQLAPDEATKNSELQSLGRLYQQYANAVAQVTGDRDGAKQLWMKGFPLIWSGQKAPAFEELYQLEAWWPAGAKGK